MELQNPLYVNIFDCEEDELEVEADKPVFRLTFQSTQARTCRFVIYTNKFVRTDLFWVEFREFRNQWVEKNYPQITK